MLMWKHRHRRNSAQCLLAKQQYAYDYYLHLLSLSRTFILSLCLPILVHRCWRLVNLVGRW